MNLKKHPLSYFEEANRHPSVSIQWLLVCCLFFAGLQDNMLFYPLSWFLLATAISFFVFTHINGPLPALYLTHGIKHSKTPVQLPATFFAVPRQQKDNLAGRQAPPSPGNMHVAEQAVIVPFEDEHASEVRTGPGKVAKRVFDFVFSLLVILLILSWLVPIIGLLIKLESRGPIFFKQKRSGLNNRVFFCYKFRSMHVNLQSDLLQAIRNDPRITRIGAFLRKTSLDEFPQFLNVLMGHMSIVGPRPHMLKHTEEYTAVIPGYLHRLKVKQGITGWAQVNGYRGETNDLKLMEARVDYDKWYVDNWSFAFDMKIILKTVLSVVKNRDNVF